MHIDWDASRRERRAKQNPSTMQVLGETITLPAGIPAGLALDMFELEAMHGEDADIRELVSETDLRAMASQIFGHARVDVWLDKTDMTIEDFADLLFTAVQAINGPAAKNPGGDAAGEEQGPDGGPDSSSTAGPRSSRTSRRTTASTSRTRTRSAA